MSYSWRARRLRATVLMLSPSSLPSRLGARRPGPFAAAIRRPYLRARALRPAWRHRPRYPLGPVLSLSPETYLQMVSHCLRGLPDEACGLLAGDPSTGVVERCYPARNAAESAKLYTVDPRDHLRADRDAEERGIEIMGVFHSHTHTDAYPSPTDVAQAPDPGWHYVLVSLRDTHPVVRSYRIREEAVEEESVTVAPR